MNKPMIKKLIVLMIIALLNGTFLIIALNQQPKIIDNSIIITTPEKVFIMVSALLIIYGMIRLLRSLLAQKSLVSSPNNSSLLQASNDMIEPIENEEEIVEEKSRFFMLRQVDAKVQEENHYTFEDDINLQRICDEFREFAAYSLGLYYDIKDIRRFIGGLAVSHIMILQGMSGTGKTSLAYAFGDYLKNPTTVVPIQPMWKERTDLIGYYNEFTKKFNETTLLKKLYEANHNDQMYITVLDEMNIARVEYYFAEFLSLLELPDHNKRHLDVIADVWDTDPALLKDGKLILPSNMWFIGTANNDDSTFSISDKVYDRAMVINLDKKAQPFIPKVMQGRSVSMSQFTVLVEKAKKQYALSSRNLRRLKEFDKYLIKQFQITFGNRIMQQIKDYVPVIIACGGSELSALDDIMSKKVLRKLETKNMVYVKNSAPSLITFIETLFGENEMSQCIEYIQTIEINA
ncbi:MAG: AAA family ATPase [Candidatus Izemoplasmataceae bacterium]